jgi:hypothetical protein
MTEPRAHARVEAEAERTPRLSLFLGYGAMAPLVLAALTVWALEGPGRGLLLQLALLWGAALLLFLSGVRRGLSFRTPGGPRKAELAAVFGLFALGLAVMIAPLPLGAALMTLGFLTLAVIDPLAARRGEAPRFFPNLRPPQMALAALASGALWLNIGA